MKTTSQVIPRRFALLTACVLYTLALQTVEAKEKVILEREPLYQAGGHPHQYHYADSPRAHPPGHHGGHPPHHHDPHELDPQSQKGKSYAFAYAVRDGDRGDDFFHKERREGKVTIGEYSVVLPDGRTQKVRYTSDAKDGYKADVTYEGDQSKGENYFIVSSTPKTYEQHLPHHGPTQPGPSAAVPAARSAPGGFGPRGPPPPGNYNPADGPVYLSYPLKARRPSGPPPHVEYGNKGSKGVIYGRPNFAAATPKPAIYGKAPYSYGAPSKVSPSFGPPPPRFSKVQPTEPTYYSGPKPSKLNASPSPNSLYEPRPTQYVRPTKYTAVLDQVTNPTSPYEGTGQSSPYKPIARGQRAGPDHHHHHHHPPGPHGPHSTRGPPPPPPRYVEPHPYPSAGPPDAYVARGPPPHSTPQSFIASPSDRVADRYLKPGPVYDNDYSGHQHHKSKLVPIEYFKAGPATQQAYQERRSEVPPRAYTISASPNPPRPPSPTYAPHINRQPEPEAYFEPRDAIHANDRFAGPGTKLISLPSSEEVYFAQQRSLQKNNIPNVKSSVASYTADYLGVTGTPIVYESSTSPGVPVGRPVKPSASGLVYLSDQPRYENPGRGPGPTSAGIRETLSRLPTISTIPTASTGPVHPYEVGRPDFGGGVAYGNTPRPQAPRTRYDQPQQEYVGPSSRPYSHPNQVHDDGLRHYIVEKRV